jgi:ABC-type cobalamin transport system permease subunit
MAQMNRNVNLEEIDSDALFGIDALKNQSILQKIVFFGCVIAGVLVNVLLPLYFETPRIVCILIFLGLLLVGVAIGCNYTEDMTYGKYMFYFFFKPTTPLFYESTEDVEKIREKAEIIKREEEMMLRRQQQADPMAQRKLLMKVIIFVIVLVVSIGAVFIYSGVKENDNLHHKVEMVTEEADE